MICLCRTIVFLVWFCLVLVMTFLRSCNWVTWNHILCFAVTKVLTVKGFYNRTPFKKICSFLSLGYSVMNLSVNSVLFCVFFWTPSISPDVFGPAQFDFREWRFYRLVDVSPFPWFYFCQYLFSDWLLKLNFLPRPLVSSTFTGS